MSVSGHLRYSQSRCSRNPTYRHCRRRQGGRSSFFTSHTPHLPCRARSQRNPVPHVRGGVRAVANMPTGVGHPVDEWVFPCCVKLSVIRRYQSEKKHPQRVSSAVFVRRRVRRGRAGVGKPRVACQRIVARGLRPDVSRGQRVGPACGVDGFVGCGRERLRFPGNARPRCRISGGFQQTGERCEDGPHVSAFRIQCRQRCPQPFHVLVKRIFQMRQGQIQIRSVFVSHQITITRRFFTCGRASVVPVRSSLTRTVSALLMVASKLYSR